MSARSWTVSPSNLREQTPAPAPGGPPAQAGASEPSKIKTLRELYDLVESTLEGDGRPVAPPVATSRIATILLRSTDPSTGKEIVEEIEAVFGLDQYEVNYGPNGFPKLQEKLQVRAPVVSANAKRAVGLYGRLDVQSLFSAMEDVALEEIEKLDWFGAQIRRCRLIHTDKAKTADVKWKPSIQKYVIRLNPKFLVHETIQHLIGGYPQSNFKFLRSKVGLMPESLVSQTVKFVICHEMGHIALCHEAKKDQLYGDYKHSQVNKWGDCQINIRLVDTLWGTDSGEVIPLGLYKDDRTFEGNIESKGKLFRGLVQHLAKFSSKVAGRAQGAGKPGSVSFRLPGGETILNKIVTDVGDYPANVMVTFHPGPYVRTGTTTSVILRILQGLVDDYRLQKVGEGVEEDDGEKQAPAPKPPAPPPEKPEELVDWVPAFGQVVVLNSTGELAVVMESVDTSSVRFDETGPAVRPVVKVQKLSAFPPKAQENIRALLIQKGT